jgi:hypothetical protein
MDQKRRAADLMQEVKRWLAQKSILADIVASRAATTEAVVSNLPGRVNGPADAFRHLLWAGELTRRFGSTDARAIVDGHEEPDQKNAQSMRETAMDKHNNDLGIALGREARSWEDVIQRSRRLIDESVGNPGAAGAATWLPEHEWSGNPMDDSGKVKLRPNWSPIDWSYRQRSDYIYPYAGEEHSLRHEVAPSLMESEGWFWPSSLNNGVYVIDLKKKAALDRARREARATGGAVHVDAYTQIRDGRPVDVSAYDRSAPTQG